VATTTTVALLTINGTTAAATTWTPSFPITFDDPDVLYVAGSYLRA
jgi:hypothetical protein